MRRILQQQATLFQRFHYQTDVALLQIAHSAVRQFCAPTRCALAEITLLEQQHVITAAGCIDCNADTSRTSANDNNVPGFCVPANAAPHLSAIHIMKLGGVRKFESNLKTRKQLVRPAIG